MAEAGTIGWIVSYPKSGNTWLRLMLLSLMRGGAAVDINRLGNDAGLASQFEIDELLVVEAGELFPQEQIAVQPALNRAIAAETGDGLKLRKVHDRYWRTPAGEAVFPASVSRGAVYMVRDPRDIAMSFAHHRGETTDHIITIMADPTVTLSAPQEKYRRQLAQPLGNWSGHVGSWLEQKDIPVLLLRYEDMVSDPVRGLRLAADHLGITHDASSLNAAVDATRFDLLQAQEQTHGFRERQEGSTAPFFRQGMAGGWRHELTAIQAARIVADHGQRMRQLGYDCGT
ncbi:sulfotransferase domain-containing protein [Niveispirillum sp. KHB5.9]|uniref:sulfotransferase domain-containing protein n=1 Tax=Niveispirillum sp. KHB5.9 TaxID=3400269 RepID=UPI003A8ADB88